MRGANTIVDGEVTDYLIKRLASVSHRRNEIFVRNNKTHWVCHCLGCDLLNQNRSFLDGSRMYTTFRESDCVEQ